MSMTRARAEAMAAALLEAQVAYHVETLSGDQLEPTVRAATEEALATLDRHPLEDLTDRSAVTATVVRGLQTVPASGAVASIVELVADILHAGPAEPVPLADLVPRDAAEAVVDELLALTPVLEALLDEVADSRLVAVTASRFMARIVAEAVPGKVPGMGTLGSLVSFGTSMTSLAVGVADKQLDGLLGESLGKGGTLAVRRLNRIIIETLRDPTTRAALLQVWDQFASKPMTGLGDVVEREEMNGLIAALHNAAEYALSTDQAADLVEEVVEGFFDWLGGYTPAELLVGLGLTREDVIADVVRAAPRLIGTLRDSGDLERLLRARLEPFYGETAVQVLMRV